MALRSRVTSKGTLIAASSSLRDFVKFASSASASSITASATPIWRASLISLFTTRVSTSAPEWKALTSFETSPVFSCTALRSSFADSTACTSMPASLASSMHRCSVSRSSGRASLASVRLLRIASRICASCSSALPSSAADALRLRALSTASPSTFGSSGGVPSSGSSSAVSSKCIAVIVISVVRASATFSSGTPNRSASLIAALSSSVLPGSTRAIRSWWSAAMCRSPISLARACSSSETPERLPSISTSRSRVGLSTSASMTPASFSLSSLISLRCERYSVTFGRGRPKRSASSSTRPNSVTSTAGRVPSSFSSFASISTI